MPRRPIFFVITLALLLVAIGALKAGLDLMGTVRSADEYIDQGVMTFVPQRIVTKREEQQLSAKAYRSHTVRTVHYLEYRASAHSSWRYRQKMSQSTAKELLAAGTPIERRVFTIKDTNRYITTEPEESAQSYAGSSYSYALILVGLGGGYCAAYLTYVVLLWRSRRR